MHHFGILGHPFNGLVSPEFLLINDDDDNDEKAGDNGVEGCAWVLVEL
jgi:hypothetical protein